MRFEFATATRIIFGAGASDNAGELAASFGRRALVVTGGKPQRAEALLRQLDGVSVATATLSIQAEPTTDDVLTGARLARERRCEVVIAFGGGRAIDAGKAIAAMAVNPGDLSDYLEVIGRGRSLQHAPLPFIAIPTTAGPGTEVTRNAVLVSRPHQVKVSLRSALMLPRLALVDPNLTLELPAAITASTGADALTQLIEPFVSARANPLTDAICRDGMGRAARALPRAYATPEDLGARTEMALASLYGGLALANAGLGAVHGLAAPIGGMFEAPHGAVCAALLPHVMEINIRALVERAPQDQALARYDEVARIVTGDEGATRGEGVAWVQRLVRHLKIQSLGDFGIAAADIPVIGEKAAAASSMKANPIPLNAKERREILERAL